MQASRLHRADIRTRDSRSWSQTSNSVDIVVATPIDFPAVSSSCSAQLRHRRARPAGPGPGCRWCRKRCVAADLGNCWMERDYETTVHRAGARIAVVQFSPGRRRPPEVSRRAIASPSGVSSSCLTDASAPTGTTSLRTRDQVSTGGFAEHMELVPGSSVYRLPEDRTAEELTFFEPLSCAISWIAPVTKDDVVVEGPGHMGLATIVAARAVGAGMVIVTGTAKDRFRLDCALDVGADHVIDVDAEDPVDRVRELTGGHMADVVLDAASGNPISVNLAMDMVKKGGHVVVAGMKDRPLEGFHNDWIPTRRITLHPGAGLDTEGAVALINDGKAPTAALIGETLPLERFEEAFALMTRQVPGRDAVRFALRLT